MKGEPSAREKEQVAKSNLFHGSIAQMLSVPRGEMQKRLAQAEKESTSRHKRYKIAPAKPPANT